MLPFPALKHATITAKKDTVSRCRKLKVPSLLVSCNPMTSQLFAAQVLSRVSMRPIPLTPLTAAVRALNVLNVSSSSRDLTLATLWFLRADFLPAYFPRRFFRANALRLSLSSRYFLPRFLPLFSRRVGRGTPTTPRHLRRRHVCLLACALRAFLLLASGPTFPTAAVSQLYWVRLPRETISLCWGALPPVDSVGRFALSASTCSCINRCHELMIHARTL